LKALIYTNKGARNTKKEKDNVQREDYSYEEYGEGQL